MIGKVLDGRYRIVRQLGAGGFAKTYLAQDTRIPLEPFCVVKHLHPQTNDSEQLKIATRLFNSEAEGLAKLGTHPQIPQLLAYFCQEGEFYLVEEFIEGQPLSVEMQRIWRAEEVRLLLIEVLEILAFIHKNGVIHRDVKPDNLMRRRSDGKLVLIDFGAIKAISQTIITTSGYASATVAVGTVGYMAPEQAQGKPRPSSDIYSLGMIAIQALTGRHLRDLQEDVNYSQLKQGAFSSPAVSKPTASLWGGLQHPQSTVTSALNNRFWCPQYNYNLKQLKLLKELSSPY